MTKKFTIVLFSPDIPGNTGSIGRTCVALNFRLVLIKPLGFEITEKALRRAGLDYWKHVDLSVYENWADYLTHEKVKEDKLIFFENNGQQSIYDYTFQGDEHLIFGSETKGLPESIYNQYHHQMLYLPMFSEHIRSLNLSNAVTAVSYLAIAPN